jgi:hypothetical protein
MISIQRDEAENTKLQRGIMAVEEKSPCACEGWVVVAGEVVVVVVVVVVVYYIFTQRECVELKCRSRRTYYARKRRWRTKRSDKGGGRQKGVRYTGRKFVFHCREVCARPRFSKPQRLIRGSLI